MDCSGEIYTNVNATASSPGAGNIPACFNGGNVNRDVYFTFTTNDTLIDVSILLQGTEMGANGPITNPQVAIYRGDCVGGLAFLGFCLSAPSGSNQLQLDVLGLTPNTTYYLLLNDYSATASPNSGDFTLCVEEYVPAISIGDEPSSSSCFGTLYDNGGPDNDYTANQNLTFVIEPAEFHQCIELSMVDFQLENGPDRINFYAGNGTNGPLIASVTGFSNGQPFVIQSDAQAVTVQFITSGFVQQAGFELTWLCSPLACDGTSFGNAIPISGLPFNQTGFTTCNDASNFAETPCNQAPFLNGPEVVFAYESSGDYCANVMVTGATPNTGIAILNGLPGAPGTQCLAQSANGMATAVDFQDAGTYYIVVANALGCTGFGLSITEAACSLNPSLQGSLCNPLNGCINPDGLPSTFIFNQGFEDISFTPGVNDGCWVNTGAAQPNYYWFTIEAQADGPFGFIVQAANPGEDSDIDFNVWGPFTREEACEDPLGVQDFIENNQPIRSSWAGGADPTGLALVNANGDPVTDPYDCEPAPGANGDDFASVIMAQEGEIYVVLINDWGNDIASGAISVDWNPSDPPVLGSITTSLVQMDTAICAGESVQLLLDTPVDDITWLGDTESLSCTDCPDPVATPAVTSTYTAIIQAVCYIDTVEVTVEVYAVDAGPDVIVCRNEEIQIVAGSDFVFADYLWTAPAGVTLSCTDCPAPFVTADAAGTYELSVILNGIGCTLGDQMILTVLDGDAPDYNISEDQQICIGESTNIGGAPVQSVTYSWTSSPPGFSANVANPQVTPDTTTTYYLEAIGPDCPVASIDSVRVEVFLPPLLNITGDTAVCQEEPVVLGNMQVESGVTYTWTGPATIEDASDPNSIAFPDNNGTYTLTAVRGACTVVESFDVTITPIAIEILDANQAPIPDTVRICRGEEVVLNTSIIPSDSIPLWTSTQPGFDTVFAAGFTVSPESQTTYYAEIGLSSGCFKIDSVVILVDSLPYNMTIMPEDTTVCEGALVLLTSPIYEPSDFPEIEFLWNPADGQETPDSLYNMVIRAQGEEMTIYQRVATSGVCVDTSFTTINVNPTPVVTIMPNDTLVCVGEVVQLIATVDENTTEYEWTGGGESLSCTDCLNPVASPGGTTMYTLEAKNEDCPATASATVQVLEPPTILLNTQTVVCLGESLQLNLAFDENTTYTWTATDPNFGTVVDPQLVVTPDETTTYFLTADNMACDPVSVQITIEVVPPPVLTAEISTPVICEGETVTLTAQVENSLPGDTFTWTDSNGAEVGSGEQATDDPDTSTDYTITYISSIGCGTRTETVSVEVLPAPVANPIGDAVICLGDAIQLSSGSDPSTIYEWTSTDPSFTDFNNPEPVVSPTQTTTYTLVAENGVCPAIQAEITIEVVGEVMLSIDVSDDELCFGEEATLTAVAVGGSSGDLFSWEGSDGSTFSGNPITVSPLGLTEYTLTYQDGAGCQTLVQTVSVDVEGEVALDGISIEADSAGGYFIGDQIFLTANYTTGLPGPLTFSWTRNDSLIDSGQGLESIGETLLISGENIYELAITTPNGCLYTASINITVEEPRVLVPNAFTPNGDTHNDFFYVVSEGNPENLAITEFKVFNRWGQLVYDNENPGLGWDGTFNNKPQPSEVYFYMISVELANGDPHSESPFRGDVTLLR